jgi:hypothetical protein
MTRRTLWTIAATLVLAGAGCKRDTQPAESKAAADAPASLTSTVAMGNPKLSRQLVSGFHNIENGAWRWTMRKFEVELATPPGAAQKGGLLEFQLSMPPVSVEKLKSQTLTASVGGTALAPETYSTPGPHIYRREIAPAQLTEPSVKVAFELDKALPPDSADIRELGLVATSVALKTR